MERLTGSVKIYKSHDTAGINDRGEPVTVRAAIKILNKDIAPETVKLKVRSVLAYGAIVRQPLLSRLVVRSCSSRWVTLSGH